ncbi:MAG TPA: carbon monoxide dehydrogenase subunit G [Nocardioidaceae bacterium]|nr:carbon monoxide dehydrogenase subunit G [Nocardioidaceae bacterium]
MKVAGEAVLSAPVENVWSALLDPSVLVRTIPGCERLETTGEHTYDMTLNAGVAAIRGVYSGTCQLSDLEPHDSLVLKAQGAGAPGTIAADVKVGFTDNGDGTTLLRYDADAVVGGMIGGVGQRMLTSVSKRMAGEFFGNVDQVLTGTVPAAVGAAPGAAAPGAPAPAPKPGEVFTAPPRPAAAAAPGDFLKGVLVGGGLVLAGVVAGALAARRRG